MISKISCIVVIYFATILIANCQENLNGLINSYFQNIRTNKQEQINTNAIYDTSNAKVVLPLLDKYTNDSLVRVRSKAYNIKDIIGNKSRNTIVKRKVVNDLLYGCQDQDDGIVYFCSAALRSYNKEAFNLVALEKLKGLLNNNQTYLNSIVKIAGVAGEKSFEPLLLNLLADARISKKTVWQIKLALARLGSEEHIREVMTTIKSIAINDNFLSEIAPDLAYIRQKESFNHLVKIIKSSEKNCNSAHPDDHDPIVCGYRALEIVAPYIKDFPLKVDAGGDLLTNDYTKALETGRLWIDKNFSNYQLIYNTF